MKFVSILATSLLVSTLAVAGCATQTDGAAETNSADSTNGFGADSIFDSMITTPDVVATRDCLAFGIAAGDRLSVIAQENVFAIERADDSAAFELKVPSEGSYVWDGTGVNRSTTKIVSRSRGLEASMSSGSTDITLAKVNDAASACVLTRCAAFGPCN